MPFETSNISQECNTTAVYQSAQTHTAVNSWGINTREPDTSTEVTVNIMLCPFTTFRRLSFTDQMGGSIDTRLYWIATEFPMVIKEQDHFIVTENGVPVIYEVQSKDLGIYLENMTTICVCKRVE